MAQKEENKEGNIDKRKKPDGVIRRI